MLDEMIAKFLRDSGLANPSEAILTPLTGGVASDIWKVETSERRLRDQEGFAEAPRGAGLECACIAQQERGRLDVGSGARGAEFGAADPCE